MINQIPRSPSFFPLCPPCSLWSDSSSLSFPVPEKSKKNRERERAQIGSFCLDSMFEFTHTPVTIFSQNRVHLPRRLS